MSTANSTDTTPDQQPPSYSQTLQISVSPQVSRQQVVEALAAAGIGVETRPLLAVHSFDGHDTLIYSAEEWLRHTHHDLAEELAWLAHTCHNGMGDDGVLMYPEDRQGLRDSLAEAIRARCQAGLELQGFMEGDALKPLFSFEGVSIAATLREGREARYSDELEVGRSLDAAAGRELVLLIDNLNAQLRVEAQPLKLEGAPLAR